MNSSAATFWLARPALTAGSCLPGQAGSLAPKVAEVAWIPARVVAAQPRELAGLLCDLHGLESVGRAWPSVVASRRSALPGRCAVAPLFETPG